MHGPVTASELAELPGAVEGIDDPEAAGTRHVLEPLLGPHVVFGVEPVELGHEELVGHAVTHRTEITHRWRIRLQLHERSTGHAGQRGRVAMLGSEVLGHPPCLDQAPVGGPSGQLVAGRQLKLAQDRRDM